MSELEDIIIQRLERLRTDIVARIESEGITASGRTQRSLAVIPYSGGVMLAAQAGNRAPLKTLEVGRPAGNVPGGFVTTKKGVRDVSKTFKYILILWARDKGFDLGWGGATMLGRRIAERGTLRNTNNVDVYSTLVQEAAKDIRGLMMDNITSRVSETINTNF